MGVAVPASFGLYRGFAAYPKTLVGEKFCMGFFRPVSFGRFSLYFRASPGRKLDSHRVGVLQFYLFDRVSFCRLGRYSHQREGRGDSAGQLYVFTDRRRFGECIGHDGRVDGADPPLAENE